MAPVYQSELYAEVKGPRYPGYAISVINKGAAVVEKARPNPIKKLNTGQNFFPKTIVGMKQEAYRAAMNMSRELAAV